MKWPRFLKRKKVEPINEEAKFAAEAKTSGNMRIDWWKAFNETPKGKNLFGRMEMHLKEVHTISPHYMPNPNRRRMTTILGMKIENYHAAESVYYDHFLKFSKRHEAPNSVIGEIETEISRL